MSAYIEERREVSVEEGMELLRQRKAKQCEVTEVCNPSIPPMTPAELDAMERARRISASRSGRGGGMDDTQPIDSAPGSITLGGVVYLVSQPSPIDMAAIVTHLKRGIRTPMQELKDDPDFQILPPEDQRKALQEKASHYFAHKDAWTSAAVAEAMLSPRGVAFAAWVFCRKESPTLTLEEVRKHVTEDNCAELFVLLNVESAMADLGNLGGLSG